MELDFAKLDRAFSPRCVAVIGDKGRLPWIRAQLPLQEKGNRLYSVQISPESIKAIEALGVKNYTSVLDIPEPVDLAIIAVPRAVAPRILDDCIRKGVAAAHFFTAGFSETDTEEGKRLEAQMVAKARDANFYLIGPNCMGIFNPAVGVRQLDVQYTDISGPVSLISQSGTHALGFSFEGHHQGVNLNKSVSFGNGVVLDSPDYLEYFGQDPSTKIIAMYIEGVKDGKRFLSVLRRVAAVKPVIIWKGGRTGEGERAIASHTGSLAVSHAVWEAAVKQCGAIAVRDMEELVDTTKALLYLKTVRGARMGIVGGSGGQAVAISDIFAEEGLEVPLLTDESYGQLRTFFTLVGGSYRNPVDTGGLNRSEMKRIIDIINQDANIDNIVLLLISRSIAGSRSDGFIEDDTNLMIDLQKTTKKPVMVVMPYHTYTGADTEQMQETVRKLMNGGVCTFFTISRCARAIKLARDYFRRRDGAAV